jgi:hypothetical protein
MANTYPAREVAEETPTFVFFPQSVFDGGAYQKRVRFADARRRKDRMEGKLILRAHRMSRLFGKSSGEILRRYNRGPDGLFMEGSRELVRDPNRYNPPEIQF